ncbi:MACPF domain-containing protein NSL1-like [Curcuma longa]|uniref:MACPF domain-containing protein NSL1-like n=1 Tax=Curcuma longa TaxID=136217 RepID=UPI003D9DB716
MMVAPSRSDLTQEAAVAAEKAVAAIGDGCGYDLCCDFSFSYVKPGPDGSRLIELDQTFVQDLFMPGGVVVPNVPKAIKCNRGGRTRYRSDVISFNHMEEQFNQILSTPRKIHSGLFNSMFGFRGCWQKDVSTTKSLAFDDWYITLYSVELVSSHIVLLDRIKQEVPSSWDPAALVE